MAEAPIRMAIFASGTGTNAKALIRYFREIHAIEVSAIFTNRPDAAVVTIADNFGIPLYTIQKSTLYQDTDKVLHDLKSLGIDFIVLAGFLLLMPASIVQSYEWRIINIHPALLPAHGGKGMYGKAVHKAVLANGENETGITIHYVNESYDDGQVIKQVKVPIDPWNDSTETVEKKVKALELNHYPRIVHEVINANTQRKLGQQRD